MLIVAMMMVGSPARPEMEARAHTIRAKHAEQNPVQ